MIPQVAAGRPRDGGPLEVPRDVVLHSGPFLDTERLSGTRITEGLAMRPTFQGSIVAMVTPFRNGAVDEAKIRELVQWHVTSGTDAIVPCGTTGESPTLSHAEHKRVVEIVVDAARGRIPVIAGTGSNSTAEAIDLTSHAKTAGARAALVVNPYYNRPTQEGLYRHFRAVAEAVDIPILVYNIQSRTAVNVETDTLQRLAKDCPNIVGVKEASGSLDQMTQVILACGPDFSVLSGDDNLTLPLMAVGGTIADLIAINGSMDYILPDIDR